uniref:p20 n=2 Tax=Gill-associated virus TaxID=96491 RepID=B6SCR0_GAV|nr:p20 [Gill-associated virus genotype 3]ACR82302.1 N protein [Gill-associated virus]
MNRRTRPSGPMPIRRPPTSQPPRNARLIEIPQSFAVERGNGWTLAYAPGKNPLPGKVIARMQASPFIQGLQDQSLQVVKSSDGKYTISKRYGKMAITYLNPNDPILPKRSTQKTIVPDPSLNIDNLAEGIHAMTMDDEEGDTQP